MIGLLGMGLGIIIRAGAGAIAAVVTRESVIQRLRRKQSNEAGYETGHEAGQEAGHRE